MMNLWKKTRNWFAVGTGIIMVGSIGGFDTSKIEIPATEYEKGSAFSQVFDIPDDAISAKIAVSRDAWEEKGDGHTVVEVFTEVWSDKINWGNHCGFTTDGGDRYFPNEETKELELATESYNDCSLYDGTNRRVRVEIRAKETISTKVSITYTTYKPTILGLIAPNVVEAAIAHVQSSANGNACGTATSCAVSYPGNTTAGSLLINTCRYGTNGYTETVTDAQSNTYTKAREEEQANDFSATLMVHYAMNTAGGSTNSTTCTISSAAIMRATVGEYSGVALTDALDQVNSGEGTSATVTSGTVSPTSDGQLIFVAGAIDQIGNFSAGTDFTIRSEVPITLERIATEDYIQPTAASHDGTFDVVVSRNWAAVIASFKPQVVSTNAPSGDILYYE